MKGIHGAVVGSLACALLAGAGGAQEVIVDCSTPLCTDRPEGGANYRIAIPDGWNAETGTLVLYAHGIRAKADRPNESDDMRPFTAPPGARAPAQAPVPWSAECASDPAGPDATDNGAGCDVADLERALLDAGYALAGSAYRDQGYIPQLGRLDTLALRDFFAARYGAPHRTLLIGLSLGSLPAYQLAEESEPIDGILTLGGLSSGNTRLLDHFVAVQVGLYALGLWDPAWGGPGDVRDDFDYETEGIGSTCCGSTVAATDPRLEFLRLVLGAAPSFAVEAGELAGGLTLPLGHAIDAAELRVSMYVIDQFIVTAGMLDVERRYGNYGVQNLDQTYCLSQSERAALENPEGPNLSPATIDGYLAAMNSHDIGPGHTLPVSGHAITPEEFAATRATLDALTPFSGALTRPLLSVRSTSDDNAAPYLDTLFRKEVAAAGRSHLLIQKYVEQTTHANNFTPAQILDAVRALERWVETGARPTAADFPAGFATGHGWLDGYVSPLPPFQCDIDGDGLLNRDGEDNCPLVANADQLDRGGINTPTPDGIGDACQCGDVTGNGIVNGQDANAIKRHTLGASPNPLFLVSGNCDVTGNGVCNGQDANAVKRAALEQPSPLFGQRCQNADYAAPVCTNCE